LAFSVAFLLRDAPTEVSEMVDGVVPTEDIVVV
jgi:hypothetical protein